MFGSSGKLLIKVKGLPFQGLMAGTGSLSLPGYTVTPLFAARQALPTFMATVPGDHWLQAEPATASARNPWDLAHEAAQTSNYLHYFEPDILHDLASGRPTEASGKTMDLWPPFPPGTPVSPGWHLATGFTGFEQVRSEATGSGIRIAHLDTGYSATQRCRPRNLRTDLAYNFSENNSNAIDPGMSHFLENPGHGTATLALLAGGHVDLSYRGQRYVGDFGGAPDAEVVPVRISPSVVHLYTSTMAKGLDYALAPGGNPANRCDVVTISHGGLPTRAWADAVNHLYEAGVVVVAASGDSFHLGLVNVATRYTVYPSAFNRVLTAVGATYDKTPYITRAFGAMQGNWGPDAVMKKAIAAFTPNVAWMDLTKPDEFKMDGAGTSAATPQVAAACALWLERYGSAYPADWQRAEACRLAILSSAAKGQGSQAQLGRGLLDVPALLRPGLASTVQELVAAGAKAKAPPDSVSWPFWRTLLGFGPPGSEQDAMYDAEVAQILASTTNPRLIDAIEEASKGAQPPSGQDAARLRAALKAEPNVSDALFAVLP